MKRGLRRGGRLRQADRTVLQRDQPLLFETTQRRAVDVDRGAQPILLGAACRLRQQPRQTAADLGVAPQPGQCRVTVHAQPAHRQFTFGAHTGGVPFLDQQPRRQKQLDRLG